MNTFHINQNIESRVRRLNKFGGDDDLPIRQKTITKSSQDYQDDADNFSDSPETKIKRLRTDEKDSDSKSDMDEYETLKESKTLAKQAKKDMKTQTLDEILQQNLGYVEPEVESKRQASYQILTNKGLTPHRPKIDRNPRLKRRVKYETAVKKLKDFRRVAVDKSSLGQYSGEASGIKTKLARSVKL